MKHFLTMVLCGACVLETSAPLFAEDGKKQPVRVTNSERVPFGPGGQLLLNTASGNLMVEAWDQPEVEITTIKSTRSSYRSNQQAQAAQCLETVRVATDHPSGTELTVSTKVAPSNFFRRLFGKCGVEVEQQIRAPRDARLVIHHHAGYVLVSRMTGEIEANSRSGDLMLMLPDPGPYSIDAQSKIGSVYSDFTGATNRSALLSEQFSSANPGPSRRIHLRMYLGAITIKELPPLPDAPVATGGQ